MTLFVASFTGIFGLWTANSLEEEDEVPWPFRRILKLNEELWKAIYRNDTLGVNPPAPKAGTELRVNGDLGIETALNLDSWQLKVNSSTDIDDRIDQKSTILSLDQFRKLPQTECTEEFKCVEGWSQTISYKGVLFSDFLTAIKVGTRDKSVWTQANDISKLYSYVGLETPDGSYYVSIDMQSMLHPKALLATEINGVLLSSAHGAPLRLIIPVKYGTKNIKRIGRIFFSDEQPPDYWTERGYDWYAAL